MLILLWSVVFMSSLENIYPPQGCKDMSVFYSSRFIIFAFSRRSVIQLQLIFVCGVRWNKVLYFSKQMHSYPSTAS